MRQRALVLAILQRGVRDMPPALPSLPARRPSRRPGGGAQRSISAA
jgi:hypothetical protein